MEVDEERRDFEKEEEEEDDSVSDLLRDRFRLSAISIAESEAKRNGMEISQPIVACIADLAFKYVGQLAKDLELFAHHASRKSVNMEDVILSAHRNEHLAASLRSFRDELKAKEPHSERKRKKGSRKDDKANDNMLVLGVMTSITRQVWSKEGDNTRMSYSFDRAIRSFRPLTKFEVVTKKEI